MTDRTLRDIRAHCEAVIAACEQGYPHSAYNELKVVLRILDAHTAAQPAPDAAAERPLPRIRFGVHSRPINPIDDR